MSPDASAGDSSFRRLYRLTAKREFDRVFREGCIRIARGPFRALAHPNTMGTARLGLVVGKRHAKRAVDRNRVRRSVRESFRAQRQSLPNLDIVVQVVRAPVDDDLDAALGAIWRRLEEKGSGGKGTSGETGRLA